MIRTLLVVYFLGSLAIALPLAFDAGHAGNLGGTTSGKILAAALIAMGIGALGAARDPLRQRLMIQVLIVFTALSAVAIAYRLATDRHPHDPAWIVLLFAIATPVLLTFFSPRPAPMAVGVDGRQDA